MRKNVYMNWFRSITAACLALMIFTSSSMIALAGTEKKSLMGEITVSGQNANGNASVLLNGESVFTGRTFFSNGTITTPDAVSSTVKLGKSGYVALAPNTTLTLSFDEKTISGTLSAGQAKVFNAEGVEVNIQNVNNATTAVAPVNKAQDDDDDGFFGGSAVGPVLVFAGIVAAAIILVVVNDDDEDGIVSRVR